MLKVNSSRVENGDIIYELKIDRNSLQYGSTENVSNAVPYLYTFHSHPYQAYRRHKTVFGFPSASDYVAMYMLHKLGAIIHFVASLEGLYIIHVNLESPLLATPKKEVINHIKKNYNIKKNSVKDLKINIEKINQQGLFVLDLIPWETKNKKIKVFFNKTNDNCVIR
jgi:hypothetical protein